jgi:hypothetical protein
VYYILVRWIHYALDAGPLVLILTALVAIFTIGLGDNTNEDGISAYSVFNRGFQRLLGTIDAEDLVAQQMGGLPGQRNPAAARPDHPPPRRPAAQEPRPAPRQAAAAQPADGENNNNQEQADPNDRPRRRLPGKKARRQNLEQRRELRRQREAALAMGFGADDQAEALAMQRLLDDQFAELEEDEA